MRNKMIQSYQGLG